jgi:hypothetical protein
MKNPHFYIAPKNQKKSLSLQENENKVLSHQKEKPVSSHVATGRILLFGHL